MRRIMAALAALACVLLLATPAWTAEDDFRVGNWFGETRRDAAGRFAFCAVSIQNEAKVFLTLTMRRKGRLDLALSNRSWTLDEGEYSGARLIIDEQGIGGFFARTLSREMLEINLHGPTTLRHRIANSRSLIVRLAGVEHGFEMKDAGRALSALESCVARERKARLPPRIFRVPARKPKAAPVAGSKKAAAPPAPTTADSHPFGKGKRWRLPADAKGWEEAIKRLMAAAGHDDVIFVSPEIMRETAGFDVALGWVADKTLGFVQPLADQARLRGFVTEALLPAMETHCPGALRPGPMRRAEAGDILVFEQSASCQGSPTGLGVHSLLLMLPGEPPRLLGFSRADREREARPELALLRSLVTTGSRP